MEDSNSEALNIIQSDDDKVVVAVMVHNIQVEVDATENEALSSRTDHLCPILVGFTNSSSVAKLVSLGLTGGGVVKSGSICSVQIHGCNKHFGETCQS